MLIFDSVKILHATGVPMLSGNSNELRSYYELVFPFEEISKWLAYEGNAVKTNSLARREFSATLHGGIYLRFLSYSNSTELRSQIIEKCPVKIDIGAIYNSRPTERKSINSVQFRPLEKELVFDIDMTDYDDVRTCCQGASVC